MKWQSATLMPSKLAAHTFTGAQAKCFYWKVCKNDATLDKEGKSVCRGCADRMHAGQEYALKGRFYLPPTGAQLEWSIIGMRQG